MLIRLWGSVLACFLCSSMAFSTCIEYGSRVLLQPDGTRIAVREFVDENGHFTLAERGYLAQSCRDDYYYYARIERDGVSLSSHKVGIDENTNAIREIFEQSQEERARMLRNEEPGRGIARAKAAAMTESPPESLIVYLVEFADIKHQNDSDWPDTANFEGTPKASYPEYTVSDFDSLLFGTNRTGTTPDGETVYGSMRDYWHDMSLGDYTLKGTIGNFDSSGVPVWVVLPETKACYDTTFTRNAFHSAVFSAVWAQARWHGKNANKIWCIIYAGMPYLGDTLHPHHSAYRQSYIMSEVWRETYPQTREANDANFAHIGVHCHEFGHALGALDYYNYWSLDHWAVMAGGAHNAIDVFGDCPAPMNPYLRAKLGWIFPDTLSAHQDDIDLTYSESMDCVYLLEQDTTHCLLVENRQTGTGWNRPLPSSGGLLIWRVKDTSFPKIDLIEADGSGGDTDNGDYFPGSSGVTSLTDFTTPSNSKMCSTTTLLSMSNSNILVTDISSSGSTMTADLSPYWWGTVDEDTAWSGDVKVGADVTVAYGTTLTVDSGTDIDLAQDAELIVEGVLDTSAGSFDGKYVFDVPSGWSMVSLPVSVTSSGFSAIFEGAVSAFEWDGGYVQVDSLEPRVGYWLNMGATGTTSEVAGQAVARVPYADLDSTWYLLGSAFEAFERAEIDSGDGDYTMLRWDGQYIQLGADSLVVPGEGYFTNIIGARDEFLIPGDDVLQKPSVPRSDEPVIWAMDQWGNTQELALEVSESDLVEWPPPPPSPLLDLRAIIGETAYGEIPCLKREEVAVIAVRGSGVRIGLAGMSGVESEWELGINGEEILWTSEGIRVSKEDEIVLRSVKAGQEVVGRNYPNPFNPSTVIPYAVSQSGLVTVEVYNAVGQVVRSLVHSSHTPGRYTVSWDGRNSEQKPVANGVYIYRVISAGSPAVSDKMMMLR